MPAIVEILDSRAATIGEAIRWGLIASTVALHSGDCAASDCTEREGFAVRPLMAIIATELEIAT